MNELEYLKELLFNALPYIKDKELRDKINKELFEGSTTHSIPVKEST